MTLCRCHASQLNSGFPLGLTATEPLGKVMRSGPGGFLKGVMICQTKLKKT